MISRISTGSFRRLSKSGCPPCASHIARRQTHSSKALSAAVARPDGRKEGDISSVFRSLSGGADEQLDARYADLKQRLLGVNKEALIASWDRLLERLREEIQTIHDQGSSVIPQIDFKDIQQPSKDFKNALERRGVAVIRGVIPEHEARDYKAEVEAYVKANPWTKGNFTPPLTI